MSHHVNLKAFLCFLHNSKKTPPVPAVNLCVFSTIPLTSSITSRTLSCFSPASPAAIAHKHTHKWSDMEKLILSPTLAPQKPRRRPHHHSLPCWLAWLDWLFHICNFLAARNRAKLICIQIGITQPVPLLKNSSPPPKHFPPPTLEKL